MNKWYKTLIDKTDPSADESGRVFIHRKVAAQKLGRELLPGEVVHHIDEDKQNNHPDNLMIFASQADHARYHQGGIAILEGDHYITKLNPTRLHKCPICGADTLLTYCSCECSAKAQQKHKWNKEELTQDLLVYSSILEITHKYNVSGNVIRKHLKQFGLPVNRKDIIQYKIEAGVLQPKKLKGEPTLPKSVDQIDKSTDEVINTFPSMEEACRQTKIDPHHISHVCAGKRKTAGGYVWRYHEEDKGD